jgi:hypothetical protein
LGAKAVVKSRAACYFFAVQICQPEKEILTMMERLNQLSLGEKLIAGGGVLMLIASFLPWYKVDFGLEGFGSVSRNGWQSPGAIWSMLALIVALAMAAAVLGPKFANMRLPDIGKYTWGQALLAAGVAVVVFIVLKLVDESSYMSFGFYLGIIAAAALAAGGYLLYSEEKAGVTRV